MWRDGWVLAGAHAHSVLLVRRRGENVCFPCLVGWLLNHLALRQPDWADLFFGMAPGHVIGEDGTRPPSLGAKELSSQAQLRLQFQAQS